MKVNITEGNVNVYLGKIVEPFKCCEIALNIFDAQDNLKFMIRGSVCQLAICCKCPCDSCQEATFELQDANGTLLTYFKKKTAGCAAAAFSDADNFSIVFPEQTTPEDRVLLMNSIIFMDFCYFENK